MGKKIQLKQGAGGQYMDAFIKQFILPSFATTSKEDISLQMLDDAAVINDIALSTDAHTVQPLIFPGGDLGSLAVCGTINDIAMIGARPLALAASFIIEEGLEETTF
jgi:hydrogenase expression/formation protein HypE